MIRLLIAFLLGVATTVAVWAASGREWGLVVGWVVFAVVYSTWTWARLWRLSPAQTQEHAAAEDPGRGLLDTLLLVSSGFSVVAVGLLLLASHSTDVLAAGAASKPPVGHPSTSATTNPTSWISPTSRSVWA